MLLQLRSIPPERILTLDGVQDAVVQRLAAGVVGGGADAGSAAVCQSAPERGTVETTWVDANTHTHTHTHTHTQRTTRKQLRA